MLERGCMNRLNERSGCMDRNMEAAFRGLISAVTGTPAAHVDLQSTWLMMGGDSIAALKLALLARERFGIALSVSAVLSAEKMAVVLGQGVDSRNT
jgi:acyl carrier protein